MNWFQKYKVFGRGEKLPWFFFFFFENILKILYLYPYPLFSFFKESMYEV